MFERRLVCALALAACVASAQTPVRAQSAVADPCALASETEVATILGYPVEPAEETSRAAGICFYTTRAIAQDGSVTYALVTDANLAQRRGFAAAQARRCAGVAKSAPNAVICKAYSDVALATDLDGYYKARTAAADASPVPVAGVEAIAASDALYVRRGALVLEIVVRRGETLDVERETELAKLLLPRIPT